MKKILALLVVLMIAVMAVTGCASEHESEITKQQRVQEEALEKMMAQQETGGKDDKVPDANAPEVVVVSVYYPAEGGSGIEMQMEDVPELDDWELTQKLKAYGVLPAAAQVIDYRPEEGILEYDGVDTLTPRQAQAIINTFAENMEISNQIKLMINGKEILTSGYNADYADIDDTYTGGADDGIASQGGPGAK